MAIGFRFHFNVFIMPIPPPHLPPPLLLFFENQIFWKIDEFSIEVAREDVLRGRTKDARPRKRGHGMGDKEEGKEQQRKEK